MTLRDYVVLDVLNIASTQFMRAGEYQASAAEMVHVFSTDPRFEAERRIIGFSTRSMGASLGRLARGRPLRREALVKRHDRRRWQLTDAGVRVLAA